MISREEITKIALQSGLEAYQIEKDYVLGWILAAISQNEQLSDSWLFKGGTCLRKCFFENYRYSEDLDFTIRDTATFHMEKLQSSVLLIAKWVYQNTGIEIDTNRSIFESLKNSSNQLILQGRIFYHGPASPTSPRAWPRIKFDITSDEVVVNPPELHTINHPYSDGSSIKDLKVHTYNFYDLLAEKTRALFDRTRPRDLYDVVEIIKRTPKIDQTQFKHALKEKCLYKNIHSLDLEALKLEACASGWKDQLSHQLHELPPFEEYWKLFQQIYLNQGLNQLHKTLKHGDSRIKK